MAVHTVRRLAADLLNVGENRIRIDSASISDVKSAMTRADVQALIDKGAIKAAKKKGRKKNVKKKRRGRGSRKGVGGISDKEKWMMKVRAQRKLLRKLLELGALEKEDKRAVYMRIKSGIFRSKKAMIAYLKENDYVDEKFELPKEEYVPKKKKKPAPKAKKEAKKEEPKKEAKKPEEKGEKK